MKKRAISALMAATMVWGAISVPALAATDAENQHDSDIVTEGVDGQHSVIGGVDTKEHKEHFRVMVSVDKNIYNFTVDPEKNGKLSALVESEKDRRTVYFDRLPVEKQTWYGGVALPTRDVQEIKGWALSDRSDFVVATNIGSTRVEVVADATALTPNTESKLDVGIARWDYEQIDATNDTWDWVDRTNHTDRVISGKEIPGVETEDGKFYPESFTTTLEREGGHDYQSTNEEGKPHTTYGYISWKVEDKSTYFDDALQPLKKDGEGGYDHTKAGYLKNLDTVAFQVVAKAYGKGWSANQQARINVRWQITSESSILPQVTNTKIKVDNWDQAQKIEIKLGEGSLRAKKISEVYMVYGKDNTQMRLDTAGTVWCTVPDVENVTAPTTDLIISAQAMQNIKASDNADKGSWIPVMFKIVYELQDGKTSESYVWLY